MPRPCPTSQVYKWYLRYKQNFTYTWGVLDTGERKERKQRLGPRTEYSELHEIGGSLLRLLAAKQWLLYYFALFASDKPLRWVERSPVPPSICWLGQAGCCRLRTDWPDSQLVQVSVLVELHSYSSQQISFKAGILPGCSIIPYLLQLMGLWSFGKYCRCLLGTSWKFLCTRLLFSGCCWVNKIGFCLL